MTRTRSTGTGVGWVAVLLVSAVAALAAFPLTEAAPSSSYRCGDVDTPVLVLPTKRGISNRKQLVSSDRSFSPINREMIERSADEDEDIPPPQPRLYDPNHKHNEPVERAEYVEHVERREVVERGDSDSVPVVEKPAATHMEESLVTRREEPPKPSMGIAVRNAIPMPELPDIRPVEHVEESRPTLRVSYDLSFYPEVRRPAYLPEARARTQYATVPAVAPVPSPTVYVIPPFLSGMAFPYFSSETGTVQMSQSPLSYPLTTVPTSSRDPLTLPAKQPVAMEEPPHVQVDVMEYNGTRRPPMSPVRYSVDCGIQNTDVPFVKATNEDDSGRIVGGVTAQQGEFPWQVSLQQKTRWGASHICGGTILSESVVVTAGHCVDGLQPSSLRIIAGVHNLFVFTGREQVRDVKRIAGKSYDRYNFARDIALLILEKPLEFDPKSVAPVCLPNPGMSYDGKDGIITGWGRLSENGKLPAELQVVKVPMVPLERCKQSYERVGYGKYIHECQVCTGAENGGLDSCQGDSGGPLTCVQSDDRHYLCGVVSWGIGCARPNFPGVYTSTPCYSDWIAEEIRSANVSGVTL